MSEAYAGKQIVGIDLHRRRSVMVRMTEAGERLETVRISNDPEYLRQVMARAGEAPEVVLEATYGWYWAADALAELGARVHLAHPLGVKAFSYRRVKNDERDAADLADLLRMGRLPEAWIAPAATRELRALVRHRAKLVALRSSMKCQVHAVLAGAGVHVPMSDLFGTAGRQLLNQVQLPPAFAARIGSATRVLECLDFEVEVFTNLITGRACQDLCVSCHSLGLAEVGSESVGVGQGEGSEGLFPALDAGAFDEPVGGFALVAGDAFLVGSLPGAFVFDVADG